MAGVSISHLIIFIASILIAGAVVGAAFSGVDQFNNAMEDRSISAAEQLRTDVSIISDPASNAIYNETTGNVTILVKNTGQLNLPADEREIDVLLDGEFVTSDRMTIDVIESNGSTWRTGDVARLSIDAGTLGPGDYRITLLVNGDSEAFSFRVEDET